MNLRQLWNDIPKWKFLLLFIAMIGAGFDGIIMSQVFSSVSKFSKNSTLNQVTIFIIYSIGFYILIELSALIKSLLQNDILKNLNEEYKMKVIKSLAAKEVENRDVAQSISTLTIDLKLIEDKYFSLIFNCTYYFILGLISMIYLLYLSPSIALLFIVFSFLPMLPSMVFGKYLKTATDDYTAANTNFIRNIKDLFQGYSVIETYGAFSTFFRRSQDSVENLETKSQVMSNRHAIVGIFSSVFSWFSYMFPLAVALIFVINGKLEANTVIALLLASDRVIYPFRNVSEYLRIIKSTESTRENIASLIVNSDVEKLENSLADTMIAPEIVIEDLSFGYNGEEKLFSDININISYGEKVLITGKSGSGKSTVLDLIQRVLMPNSGDIYMIDEGRKINNQAQAMARIQQAPYYFELSLRDNLIMELEGVSDEVLFDILNKLGLLEELGQSCLSENYGENGALLSGGQKQRIEIACALIHDKKILLVDEGTSSVDKKSSKKIRDIFFKSDMTVIEVAHHYDEDRKNNYDSQIEISDKHLTMDKI
ncbi:hypothetical protein BG262_05045 [Floricoccus penangensis]|uniref:ABC transporter n=1 Tax=Floricoccus penangensis TaxID=1859475 RepID=A0A9Q5P0J0_9LACT|nr:ABC transporter ATP-binding protein [Floricoccus penangensis]OFI46385.1 hypothetical protein BG262_05045 [Floricoccus penangensis]